MGKKSINPYKSICISIIKQRKKLIERNCCGKNKSLCLSIMNKLSKQIDAYQNKWDENGWKNFIRRNLSDFEFLIPGNKGGETIKTKLYELS